MMSIGWALRGSIGGGPLGAMIPGALWAMAIARSRRWSLSEASLFAGLCALGIGLGGQETYGQTIGLLREPSTRLWGLAGLALKGAAWGMLGGAVISLAWLLPKRALTPALLLIVATQVGWQFIDRPKLLYFSHPFLKPREEIWAGLLLSAIALLFYLRSPIPNRLALFGAIGGALGFGGGSLFNLVPVADFPGWKCMEFSFGLILGAALSLAVPQDSPQSAAAPAPFYAYPLLAAFVIGGNFYLPLRFAYTAVVALLLFPLARAPQLGWPLAFSVTLAAACLELYKVHPAWAVAFAVLPPLALPKLSISQAMLTLLACCSFIYCLEYLPIFR